MKIRFKELFVSLVIPLAAGGISGLAAGDFSSYQDIANPPLSPPAWVFPIVWTILYLLMGVSLYLILTADNASPEQKKSAVTVFLVQLAVNFMWPSIFFGWGKYLFALIWLVILWIWAAVMVSEFGKISKLAARLQLPYMIWLTFALYLNFGVVLLNR